MINPIEMFNDINRLGAPRSVSIYSILYYILFYLNYTSFDGGGLKYLLNRKPCDSPTHMPPYIPNPNLSCFNKAMP